MKILTSLKTKDKFCRILNQHNLSSDDITNYIELIFNSIEYKQTNAYPLILFPLQFCVAINNPDKIQRIIQKHLKKWYKNIKLNHCIIIPYNYDTHWDILCIYDSFCSIKDSMKSYVATEQKNIQRKITLFLKEIIKMDLFHWLKMDEYKFVVDHQFPDQIKNNCGIFAIEAMLFLSLSNKSYDNNNNNNKSSHNSYWFASHHMTSLRQLIALELKYNKLCNHRKAFENALSLDPFQNGSNMHADDDNNNNNNNNYIKQKSSKKKKLKSNAKSKTKSKSKLKLKLKDNIAMDPNQNNNNNRNTDKLKKKQSNANNNNNKKRAPLNTTEPPLKKIKLNEPSIDQQLINDALGIYDESSLNDEQQPFQTTKIPPNVIKLITKNNIKQISTKKKKE